MGISGSWAQRARVDYTGATKWGTGYNPIHESRDNVRSRLIGVKENLYPLGEPSDVVSSALQGRDIDYVVEDYVGEAIPGEYFRYQEEHPRWNDQPNQFRDDVYSPAMGEWTSWGVYDTTGIPGFPLPGPTRGMDVALDVSHGEAEERQHMTAAFTPGVSGGFTSKERGPNAVPESQDVGGNPLAQWAVNTAAVQGPGLKELSNDRAVMRDTDAPRSSIRSRTAGVAEKAYARSFAMGGGPGTADMFPRQLTPGLKRPFWTRQAAVPPAEDHFMNTMEGRTPLQRAVPADPYQGDPEVGPGTDVSYSSDWGY